MTSARGKLPHHYLKPGELLVTQEPMVISTLLGSCLSVTMFSPRRALGAICHGLLPICREAGEISCQNGCDNGLRYVSCAIFRMLDAFRQQGILPLEIDVKIFGGSDMFSRKEGKSATVGKQNIQKALEIIDGEGLKLVASDVGGERGRKIIFNTLTGEVWLKRLNQNDREWSSE